jgi:hypothetical protein
MSVSEGNLDKPIFAAWRVLDTSQQERGKEDNKMVSHHTFAGIPRMGVK